MKGHGWFGRLRGAVVVLGGFWSAGCGGQTAQAAFASDFQCPDAVSEDTDAPDRYRVTGCGREATYQCVGSLSDKVCAIQVIDGDGPPSRGSGNAPKSESARAAKSEISFEKNGDEAVLKLELALEGALLRLTATPDKQVELVQFKLIRGVHDSDSDACNLDWMVNGQVLTTPKSSAAHKGDVLAQRVQMGRDLIAEFGAAEKIALRVCERRWSLTSEQVKQVRAFMERFQEEMAWKAPPREAAPAPATSP